MKSRTPKAPPHLRESTQAWWRSVLMNYELEDHHLRLLQLAAEAWDRCQEARELLARDGLIMAGREGGMRPHPAVAIERDSRIGFSRLVRELDLDVEASAAGARPPALKSNRRGGSYHAG